MKLIIWLFPILAFGQAQTYVTFTFDPPGSTNTFVRGINNAGQIIGSYTDSAGDVHAFIRAADGATYTNIDLPGPGSADAINNVGQVAGSYSDASGQHGYVRSADGQTIKPLEPTLSPQAINDRGDIAGQIQPGGLVAQAFVRTSDGHVSVIPGWSYANDMNNTGDVVGWIHSGTNGVDHGYVQHADGSMEGGDVPGVDGRTHLYAVNNHPQTAGIVDGHVFVRNADRTYATFDAVMAGSAFTVAMDDNGRLAGSYLDGNRYHGFLAVPSGTFVQPTIRSWSGVLSASGFGGAGTIASGTWIEIYGQNLASTAREWRLSDFTGSTAPTSLDGVTVRISGRPAYISYISPTQLNALVPDGIAPGPAIVVVNNSAAYNVTVSALTPGLYTSPLLNISSRNLMAFFPDQSPVGTDHPAKPGDTITLYGVGFGPVTPSVPVGQIAQQPTHVKSDLEIRFAGTLATISYAGLAPGSVGLYQFNVVVPNGLAPSDFVAVTATLSGITLPPDSQVYRISIRQ